MVFVTNVATLCHGWHEFAWVQESQTLHIVRSRGIGQVWQSILAKPLDLDLNQRKECCVFNMMYTVIVLLRLHTE